jgi:protein-disulfide isomerase
LQTSEDKVASRQSRPAWQTALDGVASVVALAAALSIIRSQVATRSQAGRSLPVPRDPVSLDGAETRGSSAAHVALLEISDFQCPFCGRFARETLPAIEEEYLKSGRMFLAFRNLPLAEIHPFAVKAAEAAECASRQGKFWAAHDRMYHDQEHLAPADLLSIAQAIGLDNPKFQTCMSGEAAARVQQDMADVRKLGVSVTPSFFLGTIRSDGRLKVERTISGALPFRDFQVAIDAVLGPGSRSHFRHKGTP